MDDGCEGKQKFRTMASANRRAHYLKLTGDRQDRGQHPYKCKFCGAWHLTSMRSIWDKRDGKDNQKRRNRRGHQF